MFLRHEGAKMLQGAGLGVRELVRRAAKRPREAPIFTARARAAMSAAKGPRASPRRQLDKVEP